MFRFKKATILIQIDLLHRKRKKGLSFGMRLNDTVYFEVKEKKRAKAINWH